MPEDPALLQHMLREAQAEITRLQMLIAVLLRNRFGPRSERLGEEALQQGIEDIEQSLAEQAAKLEAAQPAADRPATPPKRNRGSLPEHLPRVEVVVDIADKTCGCCGAPLHAIGEDRSEMLDSAGRATAAGPAKAPSCRHPRQGVDLDRSTYAIGWAVPAGGWSHSMRWSQARFCLRQRWLPTIPLCRCWIRAAAAPRPDGSGAML
jgi:hypothetical protein